MGKYELYTAIVTPVLENGSVNYSEFRRLIDYQILSEVDGIVVGGTTGLGCLHIDELYEMSQVAIAQSEGKIKIIVGIAGNNLMTIKDTISKLNELNIDGYLVLTPYYITVSQDNLYKYYSVVSEYCKHPVIIYHVPNRTSQKFLPETMVRCLLLPNIMGIKLASYDENMLKTIREKIKNKKLYLGSDSKINDMSVWFDGIISVFSNIDPVLIKKAFNNYLTMRRLQEFLYQFNEYPNPAGIITLMNMTGYSIGKLPFPFFEMEQTEKEKLLSDYHKLKNENDIITIIGDGKMGKVLSDNLQEYNVVMLDIRKMNCEYEKRLLNSKVIIDFSHPSSISVYKKMKFLNKPIFIIGTTGYKTTDEIEKLSFDYPVLFDSNFSIGMSFLFYILKKMKNLKIFDDYKSNIMEVHHEGKLDKPSGTAIKIKNIIGTTEEISAKRVGNINGIHMVKFDGKFESLKMIHTLKNRNLIAEGVLIGMKLLLEKPKGLYSFEELVFGE